MHRKLILKKVVADELKLQWQGQNMIALEGIKNNCIKQTNRRIKKSGT
jgi:hypothetical protein